MKIPKPSKKILLGIGVLLLVGICAIAIVNRPRSGTSRQSSRPSGNTQPDISLPAVCQQAAADYPAWTNTGPDLIFWENPDKSFYYRLSPEDATTRIASPVPSSETLADMDFVGEAQISYVSRQANRWKIGLFTLNGLQPPNNELIYELAEPTTMIDTSPLSKSEFVVFSATRNRASLRWVNTDMNTKSSTFTYTVPQTADISVAASPQGTFVSFLADQKLDIYDTAGKIKLDTLQPVRSVVWVGDSYLLYTKGEQTFLYHPETRQQERVDFLTGAEYLAFSPQGGGVIAFTKNGHAVTADCQTGREIQSKKSAKVLALTSSQTAIIGMGETLNFWRFNQANWDVRLSEEPIAAFTTIWKRY